MVQINDGDNTDTKGEINVDINKKHFKKISFLVNLSEVYEQGKIAIRPFVLHMIHIQLRLCKLLQGTHN